MRVLGLAILLCLLPISSLFATDSKRYLVKLAADVATHDVLGHMESSILVDLPQHNAVAMMLSPAERQQLAAHPGIERIELRCILVDNLVVKYRPRACNAEERADSFAKLGPAVRVEGDAAVVAF